MHATVGHCARMETLLFQGHGQTDCCGNHPRFSVHIKGRDKWQVDVVGHCILIRGIQGAETGGHEGEPTELDD